MTPKQAANYLNIPLANLYRLIAKPKIIANKKGGGWVIDEESIRNYKNQIKENPVKKKPVSYRGYRRLERINVFRDQRNNQR